MIKDFAKENVEQVELPLTVEDGLTLDELLISELGFSF